MTSISINHLLIAGAILFSTGMTIVIVKQNAIMVLIGIELMLNAANLNLVAFNMKTSEAVDGQMFALFVIIVAVCETAVGLAIIVRVYRFYHDITPDNVNELKES